MIKTEGLTKCYGDVLAADGVSLEVQRGEVYGFVGLNGAGKTTVIRMLLGHVRPTAGRAWLFGERVDPGRRDLWALVGSMVESPHSYPELTVRENLEIVRRYRRLADRGAIDRVIERLRLSPYRERRAGVLSMGNKQRLGLAKALIHEPSVLILDEPTNGLDPAGIAEVRELLRELATEHGVAVFLSSHLLAEIGQLATRLGIIHGGRLITELETRHLSEFLRTRLLVRAREGARAREILARAGYDVERVGEGTMLVLTDPRAVERPDRVATLLVEGGAPPTHLEVETEGLESFFLRTIDETNTQSGDQTQFD